jgi:hypothetical protein
VDQSAGHVEHAPAKDPRHKENDRKPKHGLPLRYSVALTV